LSLAGNAGIEERIQIVDCGEVRGSDSVIRAAEEIRKRKFTVRLAHVIHCVWTKIVQRNDACNNRSKRCGNARIVYVREMLLALNRELMDFCLESLAHLAGGAGKIDEHAAWIDEVHLEAAGLEPEDDGVEILLREAESLAKFLWRKPAMIVGRAGGLQFVDKFLDGEFLFGRALQLQQHVLHLVRVSDAAAIIFGRGFGTHVAQERDAL